MVWNNHYFQSADASMIGKYCDVSTYPQFYDRIHQRFQMIPRPYQNSYDGQNGNLILKVNDSHIYPKKQRILVWKI